MRHSPNVVPLHQPPFSGKSTRKPKNQDARPREYLTEDEVDRLMKAAKSIGRHGHRDATLILLAYRHGLRVSELVSLKWAQIDLKQGQFAVVRAKNGTNSTHPLRGPEIRALRRLKRAYEGPPYVFVTERKGPLTASGVPGRRRDSSSPSIPTCCATAAGSSWRMTGRTPGRSSTTWGTGRSSVRCGTPSSPRGGSRGSGRTDRPESRYPAPAGAAAVTVARGGISPPGLGDAPP